MTCCLLNEHYAITYTIHLLLELPGLGINRTL